MIISHHHRFIFLKTRKVAGSSVELALSQLCGEQDILTPLEEESARRHCVGAQNYRLPFRDWPTSGKIRRAVGARITDRRAGYYGHITAPEVRKFLGSSRFESYFKFSIERNPWDRQVSQYYWETKNDLARPDFETYLHGSYKHKRIPNFDIYSANDNVCTDFMIRYERLEQDVNEAIRQAGIGDIHLALPRAKSGIRSQNQSYRDYYTPQTRALIGQWYEREIEQFGYRF